MVRRFHNQVWTKVYGYDSVQEFEVKNQSSLSNKGGSCLLDQVNFLPCSGSSTQPCALIASLKRSISCKSPPGRFLLEGYLMILKSPTTSQSMSSCISMSLIHKRKSLLPSLVHGPYTLESIHSEESWLD